MEANDYGEALTSIGSGIRLAHQMKDEKWTGQASVTKIVNVWITIGGEDVHFFTILQTNKMPVSKLVS